MDCGGGVGFIILLLVLAIDVTILTAPVREIDFSKSKYAEQSSEKASGRSAMSESDANQVKKPKFSASIKFGVSVALRMLLAAVSIAIMSPFLNLAVFDKDVSAELNKARTVEISQKEEALKAAFEEQKKLNLNQGDKFTDRIVALQKQNQELTAKLAGERDGTTGSKARGIGPIAKALVGDIEKNDGIIKSLQNEATAAKNDQSPELIRTQTELLNFQRLRAEDKSAELSAQFGIQPEVNSLNARLRAFETTIKNTPSAEVVRLGVAGFQLFLLAALLLMKIFEPDDVGYYYHNEVQNELVKFRAGTYNDVASDGERRSDIDFPISPSLFWSIVSKLQYKLSLRVDEQETYEKSQREARQRQRMFSDKRANLKLYEVELQQRDAALTLAQQRRQLAWQALKQYEQQTEALANQLETLETQLSAADVKMSKSEIEQGIEQTESWAYSLQERAKQRNLLARDLVRHDQELEFAQQNRDSVLRDARAENAEADEAAVAKQKSQYEKA